MMEYAIMILIDGKWHEQTVKTRGNGDIVKMIGDAAEKWCADNGGTFGGWDWIDDIDLTPLPSIEVSPF